MSLIYLICRRIELAKKYFSVDNAMHVMMQMLTAMVKLMPIMYHWNVICTSKKFLSVNTSRPLSSSLLSMSEPRVMNEIGTRMMTIDIVMSTKLIILRFRKNF